MARSSAEQDFERLALALKALGHPDRLRIAMHLLARPYSVGELANLLNLPHNVASQHLSLLRAHGIVAASRRGRFVYYSITDPTAIGITRCVQSRLLGRKNRRKTAGRKKSGKQN